MMTSVFGNIDTGELAARLGSIDIYDRRGNAIFIDDFSGGESKWGYAEVGLGARHALTTDTPYLRDTCLLLVAGSDGLMYNSILKYFYFPTKLRMGTEWIYSAEDDPDEVQIEVVVFSGTHRYYFRITADYTNKKFLIYTPVGTIDIPNGDKTFLENRYYYTHIKMVFDGATGKYIRLMYADEVYDISSFSAYSNDYVSEPAILADYTIKSTAGDNSKARLSGFIFTQDEP